MKRFAAIVLCFGLVLGLIGCDAAEEPVSMEPAVVAVEEVGNQLSSNTFDEELFSVEPAVVAVEEVGNQLSPDAFDEALLHYISSVTKGSYMVSPLSFRYALGLMLAGASGNTKTELLNAFGISSDEEWEASCLAFNGFAENYTQTATKPIKFNADGTWDFDENAEVTRALQIANSVWKRNDITQNFSEAYLDKIQKCYAAENYTFTEKNAVEKINFWANEKTHGLIPAILPQNYDARDLSPVVLMNALYLKDEWVYPFEDYATKDDDFTTADGSVITKSFMNNTESFDYYEDESTQLVVLPMQQGIYMAYVLGSTENLGEKFAQVKREHVHVSIPKIDLETSFADEQLVDFLKTRGVSQAFDEDLADFSAMLDEQIYVDDIIQKTRLKTDESGLEAAAVTGILAEIAAEADPMEPKRFIADRPFSFYIYNTVNGNSNLLFAGEIVD